MNKLPYKQKLPSQFTNADVKSLIADYIDWLHKSTVNISFSAFCRENNIPNPYQLKDYLTSNFTGLNNTIDFMRMWDEAERIREDKLIKLGIFEKVNANFLLGLMKSRFGWHDNTIVVGVSANDILEAKRLALEGNDDKK